MGYLVQHRHIDDTKDGSRGASQSAGNDHPQIPHRLRQGKMARVDGSHPIGPQCPCHTSKKRTYKKGKQLVAEEVNAHDLSGQVIIANGDEGSAYSRTDYILGQKGHQRCNGHN